MKAAWSPGGAAQWPISGVVASAATKKPGAKRPPLAVLFPRAVLLSLLCLPSLICLKLAQHP